MIHFLVPAAHSSLIGDYLDVFGAPLQEKIRVAHYEDLVNRKEFARGTYVLAALDQLSPGFAGWLFEIHQQLKDAEGVRFLNHPKHTLQRFGLLSELSQRGLNEFRAARAGGDGTDLRFPVFLRSERLHEGALSPLLHSEGEIKQAIGRALIQGHKLRELLIIEFCETADDQGYYSKYGAFVVGKRVIPRSLNYGRDWMLKHSQTEFTMAMVHDELDYVTQNPHEEQLLKIFELAQVEYGRMDYSIKNGRVQTWEINLNPTICRGLRPSTMKLAPEVDAVRARSRECFFQRFESAWREVELPADRHPAIEVNVHTGIIEAACGNGVEEQQRLLSATRTVLRPVKPIIEPISSPFLRALGWLARLNQSRQ